METFLMGELEPVAEAPAHFRAIVKGMQIKILILEPFTTNGVVVKSTFPWPMSLSSITKNT
jgi:hypothetical protein